MEVQPAMTVRIRTMTVLDNPAHLFYDEHLPLFSQWQGWLFKRFFRVNRWSERFFVLSKDQLVYFSSQEYRGKESRGSFDLVSGCCIGEITELDAPTKQMKKKVGPIV
jgi:hypothetical protein